MTRPIPEEIGGKDVYVVESHQHVLKCWAAIRQKLEAPPVLLTLDQHTDTRLAFSSFLCGKGINPLTDAIQMAAVDRCKLLDFQKLETIENAVGELKWDEHINASILGLIINFAFVVCFDASYITPQKTGPNRNELFNFVKKFPSANLDRIPFTPYDMPPDRAFVISQKSDLPNCDCAIESRWLNQVLLTAIEMVTSASESNPFTGQFVLDIDLDYFHTRKAIAPDNSLTFLWLVRNAVAVTIATEPGCVKCLRDGETLDSEYLLVRLKELIHVASKADLPKGWDKLAQTFH